MFASIIECLLRLHIAKYTSTSYLLSIFFDDDIRISLSKLTVGGLSFK